MDRDTNRDSTIADKLQYAITGLAVVVGLAAMAILGPYNASHPSQWYPAEPVGHYVGTQLTGGEVTGSGLAFTMRGPAFGVFSAGSPEKSVVKTDRGDFIVYGNFSAMTGDELELRTMMNRNKDLCVKATGKCMRLVDD